MSASKDKERGTWKIYLRYVDWQGMKQIHTKRGFATKREALEYEREFLASKSRDLNMLFESFVEIYLNDLRPRIKYNTYLTKVHIIETKIIPYFAKKSISEITAPDILQWQNELLKKSDGEGKSYSTSPKTEKSNRTIQLPQFLCDEMSDFFGMYYYLDSKVRLFNFTKSYLHHEMDRGCKLSGVKRIRVHDLRHSHVAYLIEQGFS